MPRNADSMMRPIGSFQAVQHMLADALVLTEGARSATLPRSLGSGRAAPSEAMAAAAAAKAYSARAAA